MTNVMSNDNFISTVKRFMASKPGRMPTYGGRLSTQTLKTLPTSCFFSFSLLSLFLDRLTKVVCVFSSISALGKYD